MVFSCWFFVQRNVDCKLNRPTFIKVLWSVFDVFSSYFDRLISTRRIPLRLISETYRNNWCVCVFQLLECLWREKWSSEYGLGALVISPTRELALQVSQTFKKNWISFCKLSLFFENVRKSAFRIISSKLKG